MIVKSNKNIEDIEIKNPKIINGFDFSVDFFIGKFVDEDKFLSLSLAKRFEKGLFTLKINLFNH